MEIDRQVVSRRAQPAAERDVREQMSAGGDDQLVDVWIGADDIRRPRFDEVGDVGIREPLAQPAERRRREHDIPDLAQADEEDAHLTS